MSARKQTFESAASFVTQLRVALFAAVSDYAEVSGSVSRVLRYSRAASQLCGHISSMIWELANPVPPVLKLVIFYASQRSHCGFSAFVFLHV